jgi:mannose/fructose/N-acetylgalactosamine-specific phosphotransferase system component IIB
MLRKWLHRPEEDSRKDFLYLRVDDRLIHGQVVLGWGSCLDLNHLVLANDRAAESPDEREFYVQIIPEEMGGLVLTVAQAAARSAEFRQAQARSVIVVGSIEDAVRFLQSSAPVDLLILGGVHMGPGKTRLLDYLYLSGQEVESVQALVNQGVKVICRDLPTSDFLSFEEALKAARGSR